MIGLTVSSLTKKYNRKIVFEELSFSHSKGVLGISGKNGSGKTTLMKCLAGLARPNSGSVIWEKDQRKLPKEKFKTLTGYAAPYINLYDELTVFENLEFLAEVSRQQKKDVSLLNELLKYTDAFEYRDKLYKSLSTGQQQRAKLAASLIRDPQILFLDEPGSNLDKNGHELVKKIVTNQKKKGTLVILASNDEREIALCDEVVVLS